MMNANNNVHQMGDNPLGPQQYFDSLPFITRYWIMAALGVTVAGNFQVFSPKLLSFSWVAIRTNFELWRCVTCFTYAGDFSFATLICLYMLQQFSKQYEGGGPYNTGAGGGTADYAFMLLFGMVVIMGSYPLLVAYFPLIPTFTRTLVFYVLYVWSKRNPNAPADIWGIPFPGMYLPFAYIAFTVFMGNYYFDLLHGVACGHLYYYLAHIVPTVTGKDILQTPQFLIDQFGIGEYLPPQAAPEAVPAPGGARAGAAAAPAAGAHNWGGGGNVLGRG
jgi:Derlin-2/3